MGRLEEIKELESATLKGPFSIKYGAGDWGMPIAHFIMKDGELLASIESIQPYCIGSSQKDRKMAAERRALALFFARSREDVPFLLGEVNKLSDLVERQHKMLEGFCRILKLGKPNFCPSCGGEGVCSSSCELSAIRADVENLLGESHE